MLYKDCVVLERYEASVRFILLRFQIMKVIQTKQ